MLRAALALLACAAVAPAQRPEGSQWIWASWAEELNRPQDERCYLRHVLELEAAPKKAVLQVAVDNVFRLRINGHLAGSGSNWSSPTRVDATRWLEQGENRIELEAWNQGGPAAALVFGEVELAGGKRIPIRTHGRWQSAPRPDGPWTAARVLGDHGMGPWGALQVAQASNIETLDGFEVEEIAAGHGSLISMCLDDRGGVLVAVERGGVLRLSDPDGDGLLERAESITEDCRTVQGMTWHQDKLFLTCHQGPEGPGLYVLGEGGPRLLGRFRGGGEHGPHAVIPGPDGRLYVALGNHTDLLEEPSPASPHRIWYEGHLLPVIEDPRGHANGRRAPGGIVCTVNPDGSDWQVFAGGFRNHYDLAFNAHGDLFTYDADMEWDIGLPWYRPTRVFHVVPGGEYGWRTGSGKWMHEYPDCLPPAIDVGRGSPTGLAYYDGASFPERFHGALLGGDWSQGYLYAFHLEPKGTSYRGETEILVRGRPLNITDLAVDADGAVVLTIGGRGTRGAVYRLRFAGGDSPERHHAPPAPELASIPSWSPGAIAEGLASEDPFLRFASARALERAAAAGAVAEAGSWIRAAGLDPSRRPEARIALLRAGVLDGAGLEEEVRATMRRLPALPVEELPASLRFLALAEVEKPGLLSSLRLGDGWRELRDRLPLGSRAANRQAAALLAHLGVEGAVEALLFLLRETPEREEQIHYAYCLSAIEEGWSREQRLRLLAWFEQAMQWPGGFSFQGFLRAMRARVLAAFDQDERAALVQAASAPKYSVPDTSLGGEGHDFDRALSFLEQTLTAPRRSRSEGLRIYEANCAACHQFGAVGRGVGPDLSAIGGRFNTADLLESLMHPSRVVSDQYQAIDVWTRDGKVRTGMPLRDDRGRLVLLLGDTTEETIPASAIEERRPSPLSLMPSGMLDHLTLEELADLMAMLRAGPGEPSRPDPGGWEVLFDGSSLDGWRGAEGLWALDGRKVVGHAEDLEHNTFLVHEETFGDFTLEFDAKLLSGNSGLQFRSEEFAPFRLRGYQCDMGQEYWSSLYEEGGRGMLATADPTLWQPTLAPAGWNHFLVEAQGDRLRIEMNGMTTVDLRDSERAEGLFGFQLHTGPSTHLEVRNVRVRR